MNNQKPDIGKMLENQIISTKLKSIFYGKNFFPHGRFWTWNEVAENYIIDLGFLYLENLKSAWKQKQNFDSCFSELYAIPGFKELTLSTVYNKIVFSAYFWEWWSDRFFDLCYTRTFYTILSLKVCLLYENNELPDICLLKIFAKSDYIKYCGE